MEGFDLVMMKRLFFLILFVLGMQGCLFGDGLKKADLAGAWYPADKAKLEAMLEGFISQADIHQTDGRILGMISPHAGYAYSGRTAGFGFSAVKDKGYNTVVVIGFTHRKRFGGVSIYDRGSFKTPLGDISVDSDFAKKLISQNKDFSFYPELFYEENSVEMLIPFIQTALTNARIVPVAFGPQDYKLCESLAKALASLVKDREDVLIIASSDMSHFHPYDEARNIDRHTIDLIEGFKVGELYEEIGLGRCELCGTAPVITLMLTMKLLSADNVEILKYENSGDVTGDKSSVVGYMSALFYKGVTSDQRTVTSEKKELNMLNEKQRKRLLEIARATMEEYVKNGKGLEFTETDPELLKEKGAFVTLHHKGELRGCIGSIIGRGPLYKTVRDMAIESSTKDPRFPPVSAKELKESKIEISVLSEPERATDVNKIEMGVHGVIVKRGFRSGVFLPQVATETGWSREEFLSSLCSHKAGLSADAWKDPSTEIYTFTAQVFGEE